MCEIKQTVCIFESSLYLNKNVLYAVIGADNYAIAPCNVIFLHRTYVGRFIGGFGLVSRNLIFSDTEAVQLLLEHDARDYRSTLPYAMLEEFNSLYRESN